MHLLSLPLRGRDLKDLRGEHVNHLHHGAALDFFPRDDAGDAAFRARLLGQRDLLLAVLPGPKHVPAAGGLGTVREGDEAEK